jgi:hypothetical protein
LRVIRCIPVFCTDRQELVTSMKMLIGSTSLMSF